MLRSLILLFSAALWLAFTAGAESTPYFERISRAQYISQWKEVAIQQMKEHRIPASITLAQAILESGDGNSELARDANNHFGIKCHDWTGKKVYHDDDAKKECFRKYPSAQQSFEDHSVFLKRSRYAFLFDLKITDYKGWAHGLKKAGYATNPKYPALLIRIIEENNLDQYDMMGIDPKYKPSRRVEERKKSTTNSDGEIELTLGSSNKIFKSDNNIQYVVTENNISQDALASQLELGAWQIRKYNDLDKDQRIDAGTRIYIQPKRNKANKHQTHTVATGETLYSVSQLYGVKMKKILKYSDLPDNYKAKPGDVLKLQR